MEEWQLRFRWSPPLSCGAGFVLNDSTRGCKIWPLLLGWRLPRGPRQSPEHSSPGAYYSPCLHTHRTNPACIVPPSQKREESSRISCCPTPIFSLVTAASYPLLRWQWGSNPEVQSCYLNDRDLRRTCGVAGQLTLLATLDS